MIRIIVGDYLHAFTGVAQLKRVFDHHAIAGFKISTPSPAWPN